MRSLDFDVKPCVRVFGENASVHYARFWLEKIGIKTLLAEDLTHCLVTICAGGSHEKNDAPAGEKTRITLWDFLVDAPGNGTHASAASGVSWVIGHRDGLPTPLPLDVPEKWCGLIGANLALAALIGGESTGDSTYQIDVSSADLLRSFADQNSGNYDGLSNGWHRNGSVAVQHGGIYPQGFFNCLDGQVAVVGRSRQDWKAIQQVVGNPSWTHESRFEDPFALAIDHKEIDKLLSAAFLQFDRDHLLDQAVKFGATIAPVYTHTELLSRNIVRSEMFYAHGKTNLPFLISSHNQNFIKK